MQYDAVVIGAGPNGLVAAATLAKRGRRVLVAESADEIGGHTRTIEFAPGFRAPLNADCGWVPPAVMKALGFDLRRQTSRVSLSVAGGDGTVFALPLRPDVLWAKNLSAADVIRPHSARDADRWSAFADRLHKFTGILAELYQLTPPDIDTRSIGEVLPLIGVGRKLRGLGKDDMTEFLRVMPMSIQDLLDDTFENELLKAAIASAAVRDIQQGPRSGGTTYNLLHYMVGAPKGSVRERDFPADGPDAFTRVVADLARRLGVTIRTGARVERISVRNGAVSGVVVGGEEIDSGVVISTSDPKRTLLGMVDPVWLDPDFQLAVSNIKLRGCAAYVFFAIDKLGGPRHAFETSVSLTATTAALEKAADAAKYGEISHEPHVEFFVPTLRWPHLARAGQHVVAARVQYAPYHLRNGQWDETRITALKDKATAAIERVIPGFQESILHRVALTPLDVEKRFGVTEGAITQGELTLDQILFMRPVPSWGRYAMPIEGLYLGGAGAHPGPGVLGGAGFLSAKTALAR